MNGSPYIYIQLAIISYFKMKFCWIEQLAVCCNICYNSLFVTVCSNSVIHLSSAPHVEFTKPLQDVEVREKESAKFECEVSRESAKVRPSTHKQANKDQSFKLTPGRRI